MSQQPSDGDGEGPKEPAAQEPAQEAPEPAKELPRCACGHDINHKEVQPEPHYTGFGMFLFTMGITAMPKWADYRCVRCKTILGRTTDPKVLRKFD
jgi:hypothetical protein